MAEAPKPETMHIEDAIALLCRVHLRYIDDHDWQVQMGATPVSPWDSERYGSAWATLREVVLFNRAMVRDLNSPLYSVLDAINPEVAAEFNRLAHEDQHLSQLRALLRHHPKTLRDVLEDLIRGLMQMAEVTKQYQKIAMEAASLTRHPMFIVAKDTKLESPK